MITSISSSTAEEQLVVHAVHLIIYICPLAFPPLSLSLPDFGGATAPLKCTCSLSFNLRSIPCILTRQRDLTAQKHREHSPRLWERFRSAGEVGYFESESFNNTLYDELNGPLETKLLSGCVPSIDGTFKGV